jgi:hypothetical protein
MRPCSIHLRERDAAIADDDDRPKRSIATTIHVRFLFVGRRPRRSRGAGASDSQHGGLPSRGDVKGIAADPVSFLVGTGVPIVMGQRYGSTPHGERMVGSATASRVIVTVNADSGLDGVRFRLASPSTPVPRAFPTYAMRATGLHSGSGGLGQPRAALGLRSGRRYRAA